MDWLFVLEMFIIYLILEKFFKNAIGKIQKMVFDYKVKIIMQINEYEYIIHIINTDYYIKWNTLKEKRITHEFGGRYDFCYESVLPKHSLQLAYVSEYEVQTSRLPLILVLRNWPKLYKLCTLLGIN